MGVIPFEFTMATHQNPRTTGEETVSISGLDTIFLQEVSMSSCGRRHGKTSRSLPHRYSDRIDHVEHGVLHYVLRNLANDGHRSRIKLATPKTMERVSLGTRPFIRSMDAASAALRRHEKRII
jgi:hypothetical protein